MDDLLRGARDKALRETVGSMDWDPIVQGFLCMGALVFLGILVMAFTLALVVKRKTNTASEEEGSISPDEVPAPNQLEMDSGCPAADTDPPVTTTPSSSLSAGVEVNSQGHQVGVAPSFSRSLKSDPGADTDPPVPTTPSSSPVAADTEIAPGLVLSSGVVYFLACCLPVVNGLDKGAGLWGSGFAALTLGIFVLPLVWIANPLYLIALVLSAKGRHGAALPFSVTATIIAFTSLFFLDGETPLNGATALTWASTMALLVASNILDQRR